MRAVLVVVLLAACGGGEQAPPDAGGPDAGNLHNLHILVTLDDAPYDGIHVMLHDSDGAIVAQGATGAAGRVDFDAPAFPALVTAADPANDRILTAGGLA